MTNDPTPLDIRLGLPAEPSSVPFARKTIRDALIDWGYGPDLVHDSMLVVSELVTNAITAAAGHPIRLRCTVHHGAPLLECWDPSPSIPVARPAPSTAESGRGLAIIAAYAKESGTRPSPTGAGKIIWAHMSA
ncbi:ATP-binding protein [Streptomycetaceae bacterium NBC_01309]